MEDTDPLWLHVPDKVATEMEELAGQCEELARAWIQTSGQFASEPREGSCLSADLHHVSRHIPKGPEGLGHGAPGLAGQYVSAMIQHLLALRALLQTRRVALSVWPVVRSELELAGRVGWLLEPVSQEGDPITGTQRAARYLMEALMSHCRRRYTASRMKDRPAEKLAKRSRNELRRVIEGCFPTDYPDWEQVGDNEEEWLVGGEAYLGIGQAVDMFSRRWLGDARGMYDTLSDLTHPSVSLLRSQSKVTSIGDRAQRHYETDIPTLRWQVGLGCLALYRSAQHLVRYYQFDEGALESWASECASQHQDWFPPPDETVPEPSPSR